MLLNSGQPLDTVLCPSVVDDCHVEFSTQGHEQGDEDCFFSDQLAAARHLFTQVYGIQL